MDCSLPGYSLHGISQAKILEWVAIFFSNAWKWKAKVKSLSCARRLATPWNATYQALPFMGFSRQEYWSRVPLPSTCIQIHTYEISTVEALGNWLHSSTSFFFFCFTTGLFRAFYILVSTWNIKQGSAICNYFLNRWIHPALFSESVSRECDSQVDTFTSVYEWESGEEKSSSASQPWAEWESQSSLSLLICSMRVRIALTPWAFVSICPCIHVFIDYIVSHNYYIGGLRR